MHPPREYTENSEMTRYTWYQCKPAYEAVQGNTIRYTIRRNIEKCVYNTYTGKKYSPCDDLRKIVDAASSFSKNFPRPHSLVHSVVFSQFRTRGRSTFLRQRHKGFSRPKPNHLIADHRGPRIWIVDVSIWTRGYRKKKKKKVYVCNYWAK